MNKSDFNFSDCGSFGILIPISESAQLWVADNLPADAMQFGGGTVIEHRYAEPILEGIQADGLTIQL